MADPFEEYTKALYKKHGYFGTWLPGEPLRAGDVGVLEKKYWFKRVASLEKRGISFEIREDGTADRLDFTSSSGVSIGFKAQGEAPSPGSRLQQGKAGITVEFSKQNGLVFRLHGCTFVSIEDQAVLGETILDLLRTGRWNPQWVVITQLCVAEAATILMSKSKNAKVEIVAGTKIKDPTDGDLANIDAELKIAFQSSMETSYVAERGLTPLFLCSGLRDDTFRPLPASLSAVRLLQRLTPAELTESSSLTQRIVFGKIGIEEMGEEGQQAQWQLNEEKATAKR